MAEKKDNQSRAQVAQDEERTSEQVREETKEAARKQAESEGRQSPADVQEPVDDAGEAEVQSMMDEEHEKGYRGEVPDPTPNRAYSIEGVTGTPDPTPETDAELAREARNAVFPASRAR
jgi:hypothetical protein